MKKGFVLALAVSAHLAYMVLIPIFIFGGAGLWLDRYYQASPLYVLIGIGIAFVITMIWITRRIRQVIEAIV